MTRNEIERLYELMQRCFRYEGPYTLASGRTADYYYDGKGATLDPEAAWLIGNAMVDVVLESGAEAVGGIELGCVPIADAVGLAAHVNRRRHLPTYIIRKEQKGHGTKSRFTEANVDDGRLLKPGRRVAIVEDAITTGGSIKQAIDVLREMGCEVTCVVTLVERHESNGTALRGEGFPVYRLFYTDEQGRLYIDESFFARSASTV